MTTTWVPTLLVALALSMARAVESQTWRKVLTAAAVTSLWIDYCQIHEVRDRGGHTDFVGLGTFDYTKLKIVNGTEVAANLFVPRRWRPWINAATVLLHAPDLWKRARERLGMGQYPNGAQVIRVGLRFTP